MSRGHSKSINSFPSVFVELVQTVWSGKVVRIPYPDIRSARAARCRFYDFKKLLRRQTEPHLMDMCLQAESVQVLMEGSVVVYILRDITLEAITIANALRNAGNIPNHTPEEIDAEIDALNAFNPPIQTHLTQEQLLSQYLTEPQKNIDRGDSNT